MKLRTAALLAAALAPALQVHAADIPSAFASASNFRITLIDLDPGDGIAASLQYVPPPAGAEFGLAFAEVQHVHEDPEAEFSQRAHQPAPWQAVSASTALNDGAASLSASGAVSGTSLSSLAVNVKSSADNPDGLTWAFGRAYVPLAFTLSPNTSLSISFDLSVGSTHPALDAPGSAESNIYASFASFSAAQPYSQTFSLSHSLGADRFGEIGQAETRTFTAALSSGAQAVDLSLMLHASASSLTASPVPEPTTWGMLLAGLGLVGAAARRARKQRGA